MACTQLRLPSSPQTSFVQTKKLRPNIFSLQESRREVKNPKPSFHAVSCRASSTEAKPLEITNPIGLHAMVWVGGWSHEECKKAIKGTKQAGYDLIELPVLDPVTMDADFTRACLQEYDLSASSSLVLRPDADISSADNEIAQRGEKLLLDALDFSYRVGSKYLVGVTYSAAFKYPFAFPHSIPLEKNPAKRNLVNSLRNVANKASDLGISFGVEVVNRYESNVLNTAQQAMDILSLVDHPNILVHLDSYHMNIEEGNLSRAVRTCEERLGYVHIGESHRGYLGSGTIDFPQLFRALVNSGYKGPITFESFSSAIVSAELTSTLSVWRNLWDDSEDLASHAKSFIDAQLLSAKRANVVQ